MQQRHLQIEIQQPAWILEREAELLKRSSASLRYYAVNATTASIFQSSPPQLKLQMDGQCNTRALYYCILYLIYECDEAQTARSLELALKSYVYSPLLKLDQYRLLEIDQQYRQVYDNASLKKLFVEFGQALNYERGQGRLVRMLTTFPVMDFVLRLIIRAIYHLDHTQPWTLAEGIPTPSLVECISRRMMLEMSHPQSRIYLVNNGSIRFIQSPNECSIAKFTGRSILGELALSTEDSLPIVESFEEELLNETLMSDNFTPQFNELKGSHAKFDRILQHPHLKADFQEIKDLFPEEQRQQETKKESVQQKQHKLWNVQVPSLNIPERNLNTRVMTEGEILTSLRRISPIKSLFDSPVCHENVRQYTTPQQPKQQPTKQMQPYEPYLTSGMTSPQVLKLMKPKITQDLNEKKKRSVMHLMNRRDCASEQGNIQNQKAYRELSDLLNQPRRLDTDRVYTSTSPFEHTQRTSSHVNHYNRTTMHEPSSPTLPFVSRHSFGYPTSRPVFPSYNFPRPN